TISESLAALSLYLPILFLSVIADDATTGVFATAAYLLTAANLTGDTLKDIFITSFRWTFEESGARKLLRRAHKVSGALIILVVVAIPIIIFAGSPVLEFIYGDEYSLTCLLLAVYCLDMFSLEYSTNSI